MPVQLLALAAGPSVLIDRPLLLVGRHKGCDVRLKSVRVSPRHCCLAVVRDRLVVRDLGGVGGVFVNGQRVAEAHLTAGDELVIGNFRYEVCGDVRS